MKISYGITVHNEAEELNRLLEILIHKTDKEDEIIDGMLFIEKGEITHAVSEVTIASNLKEIFMNLSAANDLEFKYRTNAPTVLIESMTLAGK